MKNIIEFEEAAMAAIAVYFIDLLDVRINWWWYIPLFFSPDISLIGLVLKNKTGEYIYTFFHHKAVAIIVGSIGLLLEMDYLSLA
jgi:hypothetical protein